jgi:peptidoglycan/LPS O-acetylase OafA/YrhL
MEKTWMPTVAGILDIIAGGQCLMEGLGLFILGIACSSFVRNFESYSYSSSVLAFMSALALPFFIIGALAIRGGIYALKRKRWRFALASSIATLLPPCILWIAAIMSPTVDWAILVSLIAQPRFYLPLLLFGIAAIVLTALSKNEFE